jgi:hypothetical protein
MPHILSSRSSQAMFMVSLFQIEDYIKTEERKTLCRLAHLLPSSEVADREGIPLLYRWLIRSGLNI